jgi:hypothetical protein
LNRDRAPASPISPPIPRSENAKLLLGEGCNIDNVNAPGHALRACRLRFC